MRKRRLSKWDITGVGVALLLFAGIIGFRAYIAGNLFPRYCKREHHRATLMMRRVWISGQADERSYYYRRWGQHMKFMHNPCKTPQVSCPLEHNEFIPDWGNFYLYCPSSIYCPDSSGHCN